MTSTLIDRRNGIAEGLAVKAPCRVATTANITLSGEQTIDGVAVVDGDRVLVKDQSTGSQNGIYDASTGVWSRANDFDGARDVVTGTRVFVNSGTIGASSEFVLTTTGAITIDSTSLSFTKIIILLAAAPNSAQFLVAVASADLSAERVPTDTASVLWSFATPGQALATVPAATTSLPGISELATSAEAITGTDTTRTITPAALAATIAAVSPALPRSYLAGCGITNDVADATNDIDIAAGVCRDGANGGNITVAALIKRLDANWAAGTNQGMRYSGAAIANGTYHIYAAGKADATQDIYAYPGVDGTDPDSSASLTTVLAALNGESGSGANYLYLRRIGSIVRAGGAIRAFSQSGDEVLWSAAAIDINNGTASTTGVLIPVTVPAGLKCGVLIAGGGTSGSQSIVFASPDESDQATVNMSGTVSGSVSVGNAAAGGATIAPHWPIRTDRSRQIRQRSSSAQAYYVVTRGYNDRRGRDA